MPRQLRWSLLGAFALALSPSLAGGQASAPQSHTVREGDTLWDLARHYLADPFLWPDIYRLNTAVVEDPHWIYPGEVLRLPGAGADHTAAVPSVDTPGPGLEGSDADGPAGGGMATPAPIEPEPEVPDTAPLFPRIGHSIAQEVLQSYVDQAYRPLRRSEFYSSGFLTENEPLPFGKVLGPVTPQQIRSLSSHANTTIFGVVAVEAPRGGSYQVGDTLLLAQLGNEVEGYGSVVVPTGLARVTESKGDHVIASVVAVYGPIRQGQRALPAERFTPAGPAREVPVTDGLRGRLLGGRGRQDLKVPQMVVFLDKGRTDGVAPGDLFEARRRPERLEDGSVRVDEVMARLQVVHVRARTATARVVTVISPDLPPGTEVRQVAKLPS